MALLFASAVFSFPGCTEEEGPAAPDPIITITTESPVTAEAAGGSGYYFEYTVENEVEGATVTCDVTYNGTETEWISIDDEQATAGKITFGIGYYENTEAGRTATIKVTYSYGDGMIVSDDLEVSQAAADVPLPVIEITDLGEDGKVHVEGNATEWGMIFVSVKNAEGLEGSLSGETEAGWISDIRPMADASNGLVFTVTDNYEGSERTATITVSYTWEGGKVSAPVEIVQDALPVATAVYKGNNEFWLTIPVSEDEFFFFDLFTTDTDGTSIPVNSDSMGRYFIYNETTGTGFVEGNSYYSASGEKTILEYGFIEIKYSGNDIVISGTVGNNSSDIGATPNYTGPVSITTD